MNSDFLLRVVDEVSLMLGTTPLSAKCKVEALASLEKNKFVDVWIKENCSGNFYKSDKALFSRCMKISQTYYFEKEEDAVAFKLRWLGEL